MIIKYEEKEKQKKMNSEEEKDKDIKELKMMQLKWQVMIDECIMTTKEIVKKIERLQRYLKNICKICLLY